MPSLSTYMKILGGTVTLGTIVALPFVISDILSHSKREEEPAESEPTDRKDVNLNTECSYHQKQRKQVCKTKVSIDPASQTQSTSKK